MSSVKRFDFSVDSSGESITETSNGRFVRYDDYAALAREREAAEAQLTAAKHLAERRGKHMARQSQHLYDTRKKLRKVEEERDGHRERCEELEAALRGGE